MQAAEVRLEDIGKRFGDQWVVCEVNLHIRAGDFFTFLGPSGCGKTTLLRMIAGFATPDQGSIYLDGQMLNLVPPWQRNIGMVFQNYALWPHLTVFENVAFGLRERKVSRGEIFRRVSEVLEKVDLAGRETRRPSQLSGGQQQRVALARTLVIEPKVLLLDEPLSNLDAKLRVEMRIELLKLQRDLGLTTIYVTHDQEEALAMSTQIAVMNQGRVVQVGAPRVIYEQPANEFVVGFVGQANLLTGKLSGQNENTLLVDIGDGVLIHALAGPLTDAHQTGDTVWLSVRPEATEVKPAGALDLGDNRLSGEVTASAYQGSFVEYEVAAARKVFRSRMANPMGKALFQRGDAIILCFAKEAVALIPGRSSA